MRSRAKDPTALVIVANVQYSAGPGIYDFFTFRNSNLTKGTAAANVRSGFLVMINFSFNVSHVDKTVVLFKMLNSGCYSDSEDLDIWEKLLVNESFYNTRITKSLRNA